MKKINFITETYQLLEDDAYCIDIVKDINRFSVYLYHIDCSVKLFVGGMWGYGKSNDDTDKILEYAYSFATQKLPYYKMHYQGVNGE